MCVYASNTHSYAKFTFMSTSNKLQVLTLDMIMYQGVADLDITYAVAKISACTLYSLARMKVIMPCGTAAC
jgi:hypothetical protein